MQQPVIRPVYRGKVFGLQFYIWLRALFGSAC